MAEAEEGAGHVLSEEELQVEAVLGALCTGEKGMGLVKGGKGAWICR